MGFRWRMRSDLVAVWRESLESHSRLFDLCLLRLHQLWTSDLLYRPRLLIEKHSVNSSGVKRVSDQRESLRCAADLRWAGRSRSPCRSWRGCPGAGGEWPIAPAPFYHPASFWRRPALSLPSRPLTSLKLWDAGDVSCDTRPQHKGLKEILEASSELKHTECVNECSLLTVNTKPGWSRYFSIIMFLWFLCYYLSSGLWLYWYSIIQIIQFMTELLIFVFVILFVLMGPRKNKW